MLKLQVQYFNSKFAIGIYYSSYWTWRKNLGRDIFDLLMLKLSL